MRHLLAIIGTVCFAAAVSAAEPSPNASPPLTFEAHVRPILKAHCFQCHGEEEKHEGKLDVRLVRLLLKGGESGGAIVAGKASESLLGQRIADGEMPPGNNKKLSAKDLDTITRWIDQGAKTARPEPEALVHESLLTDEERSFWSFQRIRRPPLPTVKANDAARSPVDLFLLSRLEEKGLTFSPAAEKRSLIRRVYFDLLGIPPTPEAVAIFVADERPDAFERLVDELLASPHYGERWGRHWLDVAGYADSDGYSEKDSERKFLYKFRDYVIRSFNNDKPLDEFVREQLAGDEMLTPPYANLSPEQADRLIATGFLRAGPDGTSDPAVDQLLARNDVMAETIKIVSTSLLGLSVGCAQCHDHRYDPISQVDYYRLRAIFEPAYDWKRWRAPGARIVSLWTDEIRRQAADVDAQLEALKTARAADLESVVQDTFESELAKLPEEKRELARQARGTPANKRNDEQKQIVKEFPSLNVDKGSVYLYNRKQVDGLNKKYDGLTSELRAKRPPEDNVQCLTEIPGQVPATFLFSRGDINQPRQPVEPAELAVLTAARSVTLPQDDPAVPTTGRRLAYARHLTSGEHPLLARVLANRLWHHHFGRGIVGTPADFGTLGERPSHPELLDWLAAEMQGSGVGGQESGINFERWSMKRMHRRMLLSTAYRQTSIRTEQLDGIDPENRLLGRMSVKRLEAEALRDSILSVSGKLSSKMFGAGVPVTPDEVGQIVLGIDTRDSAGRPTGKVVPLGEDEFRRSIYVQVRRSMPLGMLDTFDAPTLNPNCESRNSSTVAPQSLLMMNNETVLTHAEYFAQRVIADTGSDPAAQIRCVWELAFGRAPTENERQQSLAFLQAEAEEFASQTIAVDPKSKAPPPTPAARALAAACQAVLSSNAFLYVD